MKGWNRFWLLVPLWLNLAHAGEPPAEPLLRLETGMHTAIIHRIAVDAQERYLASASDDKTVRVWDLKDGRLLQVLRVPIGTEVDEGKLFAVALSPDASTVAAGGWTDFAWDRWFSIYLLDRTSGRLMRRLTGLPSAVLHLTYSPDGRYLAATLARGGLRVYRTDTWEEAARDVDYGDRSYGAAFAPDGRLATTSFDGYVRLYDERFHLMKQEKAPGRAAALRGGVLPGWAQARGGL